MSAHREQQPFSLRAGRVASVITIVAMLVFAYAAGNVAAAGSTAAASVTDDLTFLQQQRAACQAMRNSETSTTPKSQRDWTRTCIANADRAIAALLATPTPTPTGSPTATPSPTTTSPSPTPTQSPSSSPTPSSTTPAPSPTPQPVGWPGPDNTGVPAGTILTVYSGPCTITLANTVIDSKAVGCDLLIRAAGVKITRTRVTGTVNIDAPAGSTTLMLTISASEINAGNREATGLTDGLFDAQGIEVTGGNRGVLCAWRCSLRDSWIHGTYVQGATHASAVRAERYSTIVHNTLACDWLVPTPLPDDGGCSADLTGYPDFAPPHDWLIQGNLFVANPCAGCPVGPASQPNGAAFCAYGGSTGGKPFSSDPMTGVNIVFRDNVFQRGATGRCAAYGAIESFNPDRPGAVWSNNRYDDGVLVNP